MKLYLMQHGRPVSKEENAERPLSDQGANDIRRIADFLEKGGVRIDEIIHSDKTRARQTAEIMNSRVNPGGKPIEKSCLSPLDDVKKIADHIRKREKDLMIVGHLPHLGKLSSLLVCGSESIPVVTFQQGGVVCFLRANDGVWTVAWMLVPEMILSQA